MRYTTTMHHGLERCKHISRHVLQYEEADAALERRRGSPHFKASGLATWHPLHTTESGDQGRGQVTKWQQERLQGHCMDTPAAK